MKSCLLWRIQQSLTLLLCIPVPKIVFRFWFDRSFAGGGYGMVADDWRHRVRVCCKLLGDMHICAGGCIPLCGSGSQVRGALTKFHVSSMSSKTWWSCCFSSHGKVDKVFFFNKGQTINLRTNLHHYGRALSFAGNWGAQEFMVH